MSDPSSSIDTRLVRRLADILSETGLTEIEIERGELKIRVARMPAPQTVTMAAPAQAAAAAPVPVPVAVAPAAAEAPPTERLPPGEVLKSPMVGTVYLAAEPSSPAFIKVGDTVAVGQTLLIIEAMKTMNAVAATKAGVVRAILVTNSQPVEFGEPLAVIE